jgi:hypothetical protein
MFRVGNRVVLSMTTEQPKTVYPVLWNDRHADPDVYVFANAADAVRWARAKVRELEPSELDEELTPSMQAAGWLYYGRYSLEGDYIRVTFAEVQESFVEVTDAMIDAAAEVLGSAVSADTEYSLTRELSRKDYRDMIEAALKTQGGST